MKELQRPFELQDPYKALGDYLTADYGYDLAVEPNGTHYITPRNVIDLNTHCVRIPCPGTGNLDSSLFCEDFVEQAEDGYYYEIGTNRRVGTLEDVICECIKDGDVEALLDIMSSAIRRRVEEKQQMY